MKKLSAKGMAALRYAARGWPVFPLFEAIDGRCACGNRKCKDVGKHPRTRRGFKDASKDKRNIRAWWTEFANANIGIATGRKSQLLVLDVDPQHNGDKSLKKILKGTDSPQTPTVRTGGGGLHFYFRYPSDVEAKTRQGILPGLDVKAKGGYAIVPPSVHESGRNYTWAHGLTPRKGWTALCPAHEDHNPSLSIAEGHDQRVLMHCFAGCDVKEIVEAIDLKLSDLFQHPRTKIHQRGSARP